MSGVRPVRNRDSPRTGCSRTIDASRRPSWSDRARRPSPRPPGRRRRRWAASGRDPRIRRGRAHAEGEWGKERVHAIRGAIDEPGADSSQHRGRRYHRREASPTLRWPGRAASESRHGGGLDLRTTVRARAAGRDKGSTANALSHRHTCLLEFGARRGAIRRTHVVSRRGHGRRCAWRAWGRHWRGGRLCRAPRRQENRSGQRSPRQLDHRRIVSP